MLPYHSKFSYQVLLDKSNTPAFINAIDSLQEKYTGVIYSVRKSVPGKVSTQKERAQELSNWLDVDFSDKSTYIPEVFIPKSELDTIYVLVLKDIKDLKTAWAKNFHKKNGAYLAVHVFSSRPDKKEDFTEFDKQLLSAIKRDFKLKKTPNMEAISQINEVYDKLVKGKHSTLPIKKEFLPILELIQDSNFRKTLIRAKQAKEPTITNIIKSTGLKESTVFPLLSKMVETKLLEKQYNVVCSSCHTTLAKVGKQTAIKEMAKNKVLCPTCKTPVTGKSVVDCYVSTDTATLLLDGNKWMDMVVRLKLNYFIPAISAFASVKDGPNELDIVANIDGSLVLMELKDNRFSIGHAYSFVGKCSQYRPNIPIIVATDGIDKDVKEYLLNTGIRAHFVESIQELHDKLAEILSRKNSQLLSRLMAEIPWNTMILGEFFTAFDLKSPILDKMLSPRYRSSRYTGSDFE